MQNQQICACVSKCLAYLTHIFAKTFRKTNILAKKQVFFMKICENLMLLKYFYNIGSFVWLLLANFSLSIRNLRKSQISQFSKRKNFAKISRKCSLVYHIFGSKFSRECDKKISFQPYIVHIVTCWTRWAFTNYALERASVSFNEKETQDCEKR